MVKRIFCEFLATLWNLRVEKTARKGGRVVPIPWFLFPFLFLFFAPLSGTAQTAAAEAKPDAVVVVMPVKADEGLQAAGFQNGIGNAVNRIAGYTARVRTLEDYPEYASAFPNAAPTSAYVQDSSFALTSEYYTGMDNRQHFQVWLWNSADGAPIGTDEMVFDSMAEGTDYLPGLVSWIISLAPKEEDETITREIVREIVTEMFDVLESDTTTYNTTNTTTAIAPEEAKSYFHLYMGLRGGASLNTYTVKEFGTFKGSSEQGFGGELAFALELRPWRFLSLQTEALLFLETFNVVEVLAESGAEDPNTPVGITSISLLVPLLLKFPFEVGGIGLYFSFGPYFVLPLTQARDLVKDLVDIDVVSYQMALPYGVCFGLDTGYRLGRGDLFVSLRYNYDLGVAAIADELQFNRQRLVISFGFRIGLFEAATKK
jgi:hypothetical protein